MKKNLKAIAILALFFLFQPKVFAAVYTWIGANKASFYTPSNFTPSRNTPTATDTIIITGGLGGDTIVAEAWWAATGYYYFEIGVLKITNGRMVTLNCISNNFTYTSCMSIRGVGGKSLQIDSNCQFNIYANSNNFPCCWATVDIGSIVSETQALINGKLTLNSVFGTHTGSGYDKTFYLRFRKITILVNGSIEILSNSLNLNTNGNENYIEFYPNSNISSKVILNGDLVYKGGRASTNFKDSILQVQPTGRVILNFSGNATEHNLKGIYLPGSQVVINDILALIQL